MLAHSLKATLQSTASILNSNYALPALGHAPLPSDFTHSRTGIQGSLPCSPRTW
jgi:hypothetical protein